MVLHLMLALLLLVLAVRRCRLRGAGRGWGGLADMPGPAPWPLLGTLPWYWTGRYSWDRLHTTGLAKYNQYGPAVREQVPPPCSCTCTCPDQVVPGVDVVWLFDPADIRAMYRAEGRQPSRRSHTALAHLRLSRPGQYNTPGLLPTNGPQWERVRRPLQHPVTINKLWTVEAKLLRYLS